MTTPYEPYDPNRGYGEPSYQPTSQHPAWDQQGHPGAPSYQPTTPHDAWGQYPQQGQYPHQGQYPQQSWDQQQGQYPQQGWDNLPPYNVGPAKPKGRGRLVALSAAVIVLAGGGVATYAAVSSSDPTGGAATPQAAITKLVSDINANDLVGVLDDLPPGERDAITKPFLDTVDQLKRTQVLRSDADLHKVDGVDVSASNLTFASKTVTVNDHVQVVELTGGTIHVSADAAKLPFTSQFLNLAAPDGLKGSTVDQTVDVGQKVRQSGKPIRLATQKVDGRWYPSLLYTIADNAVTSQHLTAPTSSIPANGASSADEAVRGFVEALLAGRVERAIELSSPDELAVLHDYGQLVVDRAHYSAAPVQITNLTFSDSSVSGGVLVTLKEIDLTAQGQTVSVKVDGQCISATVGGETRRFCGSDIANSLGSTGISLTPDQAAALSRAFSGISKLGLTATQSGGKWYVNPIRSYFSLSATVLAGLHDGDLLTLIGIVRDR